MELVIRKTRHGWKWVVEETLGRRESSALGEMFEKKAGAVLETGRGDSIAENARSLDFAGSFAGAHDPSSLGMTGTGALEICEQQRAVIPWIYAAVDPQEKWWERLRGNPKRAGEISQAAFLLKAEMMGFHVALPWGDSERYDFVVWSQDARRVFRVQVKGTGRLYRRGYEVQPVHSTRKGGKKRYTKKDIDVIAAHVQPADAWYLIPIEKVGRAKSLRLYPGIESRQSAGRKGREWEKWRDAWEVLGTG